MRGKFRGSLLVIGVTMTLSGEGLAQRINEQPPYIPLSCAQTYDCLSNYERDAIAFRHRVLATQRQDGGKLTAAHLEAFKIERAELDAKRPRLESH